jgi:hypothetical protein
MGRVAVLNEVTDDDPCIAVLLMTVQSVVISIGRAASLKPCPRKTKLVVQRSVWTIPQPGKMSPSGESQRGTPFVRESDPLTKKVRHQRHRNTENGDQEQCEHLLWVIYPL